MFAPRNAGAAATGKNESKNNTKNKMRSKSSSKKNTTASSKTSFSSAVVSSGATGLTGGAKSGFQTQVFVKVVFDFDYLAEDGKKVFMNENEVLLLINKTNQDWWQVIRRGDRRPFYAPAKYVVQLSPEEIETLRRKHNATIHNSSDGGVRLRQQHQQLTTFGTSQVHVDNSNYNNNSNNNNKRSSYSPSVNNQGQELPFLVNNKFQERYRSNSLDSILVSDSSNNFPPKPILPNRNSAFEFKVNGSGAVPGFIGGPLPQQHPASQNNSHHHPQQQQQQHQALFTKKYPPLSSAQLRSLEKRPTFDSLDKRKSWSVDTKTNNENIHLFGQQQQQQEKKNVLRNARGQTLNQVQQQLSTTSKGRISAYQNTQALFGSSLPSANKSRNLQTPAASAASATLEPADKRRKPIPLPRSKIPPSAAPAAPAEVPANENKVSNIGQSLHSRFFSKRSKTDLGSDGLAAYKAGRNSTAAAAAKSKYPAPKVPVFHRPVPQKRSDSYQALDVSVNSQKTKEFLSNNEKPIKPEIKEKPLFSTFKSQNSTSSTSEEITTHFPSVIPDQQIPKRLSKAVSESDLIQSLKIVEEESSNKVLDDFKVVEHVSSVEPVSITVNSDSSDDPAAELRDSESNMKKESPSNSSRTFLVQHSQEETRPDGSVNKKLVIDTSKAFEPLKEEVIVKHVEEIEEEEELEEEMVLPPKSFGSSTSEPLQITTKPLTDQRIEDKMSEGADKSCSTSFDSMEEGSMALKDLSEEGEWSHSPLDMSNESVELRRVTKSPSMSISSRSPPSPVPHGLTPIKQHIVPDWNEYEDNQSGRKFYYNTLTKEKSWKPPRKPRHEGSPFDSSDNSQNTLDDRTIRSGGEEEDEPLDVMDGKDEKSNSKTNSEESLEIEVPNGYERKKDKDNGSTFYENMFTGVKWYSAKDKLGKIYFYEENGNESSWRLPNVSQSFQENNRNKNSNDNSSEDPPNSNRRSSSSVKKPLTGSTRRIAENYKSMQISSTESEFSSLPRKTESSSSSSSKMTKTEMLERKFTLPIASSNFQIGNVNIVVLKQGPLNKTRLIENGKKVRKNWSTSHAVLTDMFLLFFKDQKSFASMQNNEKSHQQHLKPELCVDLKGANVDWCSMEVSKRGNVFEVSTMLGLTILLQDESLQVSAEWYQEIREAMERLSDHRKQRHEDDFELEQEPSQTLERKTSDSSQSSTLTHHPLDKRKYSNNSNASTSSKVSRTRSLKMKILGSNEELLEEFPGPAQPSSAPIITGSSASGTNRSNIREKLKKFFMRRPTMDDLFKKGIIKNEPVFGSTLKELQSIDSSDVPLFVLKCIGEIEKRDFLRTDGVYRQSGNLSTIQKIRLQVDQGNLAILETVDDVHVLTGALKLFFRELKEPLIPWSCVHRLIGASGMAVQKQKVRQLREVITKEMPVTNRATLSALLKHLIKVTELKEFNRMQVPNLAIVFGPTLMWPPSSLVSQNLALDMMQQNIVVEALLTNLDSIF